MNDRRPTDRSEEDCEEISCREAIERVYAFLDGELDPDWMERVRSHARMCERCTPHFEFERAFLAHIRKKGLGRAKSELLEKRIREALDSG